MSRSARLGWRQAVGALLGIGLFWLAARGVSWPQVAAALASAQWLLIAVAIACVVLATAVRAWCWRRLLVANSVPVSFIQAWKILVIGQFLNICIPMRAGDVARVYLMGEAGHMTKTGAATSLVLEKFFDATTLLLLLVPIALFMELPAGLGEARGFVFAAVLLPLVVIGLSWRGVGLLPLLERRAGVRGGWVAWLARQGRMVVDSLTVLHRWRALVVLQVGYLGVWLALVGVNLAVLHALGISAPAVAALVVMIVLQLGTAVPSTPGKIGVFQVLAVIALAPFGIAREPALTYGVLLHVVGFGPVVALGGLWWWTGWSERR